MMPFFSMEMNSSLAASSLSPCSMKKFADQWQPAGNSVVNYIMHRGGQGLARVNHILILSEQLTNPGQGDGHSAEGILPAAGGYLQ
jgi:hypothetical protein